MPVDERTRRMMGESLVRLHGEEVADAMMAMLTAADVSKLATMQSLEVLEARMGERLERRMRQQTFMVFVALLFSPAVSKLVDRFSAVLG